MMPMVMPPSAEAAGSSSRGSSRGVMALRVAITIELAEAFTMDSPYSHHCVSCPLQARTARSRVEQKVTEAARSATVRRSKASASIPPYRPAITMGASPATAIIDTAKVEPVSANMCSMTAAMVSCPPSPLSVDPIHMRANAGEARNGDRSMKALRLMRGGTRDTDRDWRAA